MDIFSSVAEMHNMQNVHGRYHFSLFAQSVDKSQKENVIKDVSCSSTTMLSQIKIERAKNNIKKILLARTSKQMPPSDRICSPVIPCDASGHLNPLPWHFSPCMKLSQTNVSGNYHFFPKGFFHPNFPDKYMQGRSVYGYWYPARNLELFESRLPYVDTPYLAKIIFLCI